MANKRYAIIRVDDNWCPSAFDNISMEFVCTNKTNIVSEKNCANCRYGDTKEQMIAKVLQVMRRNHLGWCNMKRISKEIVEFLGVKE